MAIAAQLDVQFGVIEQLREAIPGKEGGCTFTQRDDVFNRQFGEHPFALTPDTRGVSLILRTPAFFKKIAPLLCGFLFERVHIMAYLEQISGLGAAVDDFGQSIAFAIFGVDTLKPGAGHNQRIFPARRADNNIVICNLREF